MPKRLVRQKLLAQRKTLSPADCQRLSRQIQQRLLASDIYRQAQVIALYSPINNEVQTDLLFTASSKDGKQVCFPRTCDGSLEFVAVSDLAELQPGRFGVAEPAGGDLVSVAEVCLIVVPGVAFDRAGHRLGYGKGFYDRELGRVSAAAVSVGFCYGFQLTDGLPREEHDQPVHYLATEAEFIPCHNAVTGSQ